MKQRRKKSILPTHVFDDLDEESAEYKKLLDEKPRTPSNKKDNPGNN